MIQDYTEFPEVAIQAIQAALEVSLHSFDYNLIIEERQIFNQVNFNVIFFVSLAVY